MSQPQYFRNPNFIDSAVKNISIIIIGGGDWTNDQNAIYQNKITTV